LGSVRVAFAGLSPLCEGIFRSALARRQEIEFVSPWAQLPSLASESESDAAAREVLVIELEGDRLPRSLHVLLGAAPSLCIVGLSADARTASIFSLRETRTVFFDCSADQLCRVLGEGAPG
jgi:hypothetical protein